MDYRDKELLNEIQTGFPVEPHPYRVLGERLNMTEAEVRQRIAGLKEEGIIRRIGASINSRRVGYVSTLLAAEVPQEKFDSFVETVNACSGVTHNYEREGELNLWFTVTMKTMDDIDKFITNLENTFSIKIYKFPEKRTFKIKTFFPV